MAVNKYIRRRKSISSSRNCLLEKNEITFLLFLYSKSIIQQRKKNLPFIVSHTRLFGSILRFL